MAGGAQSVKRIPRIKFPKRRPAPAPSGGSGKEDASEGGGPNQSSFSGSKATASVGGKASLQPKRTPVSNDEIEAILLGGCI